MLDWIFEGMANWVASVMTQLMDAVSGLFLDALGTEMTAMEEYFPFIAKAFTIMQYTSWAMLFIITVWQLFRVFGGPISGSISETDNPWSLIARNALFAVLIAYAKPIFLFVLKIARAPYTALMDVTLTAESFTFAGIENALINGLVSAVSTVSIVGLLLIIILMISLGWNYFKLLLEVVERYVVVGVLCYTSPLAYSMGASKATSQVFRSWCRMVGSQLLLLVMNVWFLRGVNSSMGHFAANGGALSTGKGNVFLWLFCAIAFLKTAQRFDSYLSSLGLNVAATGSGLGMEMLMAARVLTGFAGGHRRAGSVFGNTGFGTGKAGTATTARIFNIPKMSGMPGVSSARRTTSASQGVNSPGTVNIPNMANAANRAGSPNKSGTANAPNMGNTSNREGVPNMSGAANASNTGNPANRTGETNMSGTANIPNASNTVNRTDAPNTSGTANATNAANTMNRTSSPNMSGTESTPNAANTAGRTSSQNASGVRNMAGPAGTADSNRTVRSSDTPPSALSRFATGIANMFRGNSYVRDAVVQGGTRMGAGGSIGFVGRAFGGISARRGAELTSNSISSVATRPPDVSGAIAGDIADRSLYNYMPQFGGYELSGTQITGGHIVTTAVGADGSAATVELFNADMFDMPEAPHTVVIAADGSGWYQMAGGDGADAFYAVPEFTGSMSERVADIFPNAEEGTVLRTVGDGAIEASNGNSNTMWYSSAHYEEPEAPHSVIESSNGLQWYAMQPKAEIPEFETGDEAQAYNLAQYRQMMPGYENSVTSVDASHREDGFFEVRHADGSGTRFYDSSQYAVPRGEYRVYEDASGNRWYAVQGTPSVERRPVYENGKPVYSGDNVRTVSVETVRYRTIPRRFEEPTPRKSGSSGKTSKTSKKKQK